MGTCWQHHVGKSATCTCRQKCDILMLGRHVTFATTKLIYCYKYHSMLQHKKHKLVVVVVVVVVVVELLAVAVAVAVAVDVCWMII